MPWRIGRVASLRSSNHQGSHWMTLSTDGLSYRFSDNNWESTEAMVSVAAAAKNQTKDHPLGAFVQIFETGSVISTIFWA